MEVATLFVLSATTLPAQAPRPVIVPGNTVLLAAYNCAADQLARADAIVSEVAAPVLNKQVAAGKVISWGYIGGYLAGQTNRHIYLWAADPVTLIQARQVYLPELLGNPKFMEFVKICGAANVTLHNLITSSTSK